MSEFASPAGHSTDPGTGSPDLDRDCTASSHPYPPESQTARAMEIYPVSASRIPDSFWLSVLTVKEAACRMNLELGFLAPDRANALLAALAWFRHPEEGGQRRREWFCLDAWQGGAGTSINMCANEALALVAMKESGIALDPLLEVNLHQSTNDVLPTALRLMLLDRLSGLEILVTRLQAACQDREKAWAGVPMPAHTQLQDAVVMDAGKTGATWAGCLGRDRWRIFKGRERIKEVNLGGTAIGSGSGAPRPYVLGVVRQLQKLTPHPVTRSEDLFEATSNFDGLSEAMDAVNLLAQDISRIAGDIRLLASGPSSGMGILKVPAWVKGSSIMPGKVNPVMAELMVQIAWRIMGNHSLLVQAGGHSELQLNAFFPLILQTCHESLELLEGSLEGFARYVEALELDRQACERGLEGLGTWSLVLVPLLGYHCVEAMIASARSKNVSLKVELESTGLLDQAVLDLLCSPRQALSLGYDPGLYRKLAEEHRTALEALRKKYI